MNVPNQLECYITHGREACWGKHSCQIYFWSKILFHILVKDLKIDGLGFFPTVSKLKKRKLKSFPSRFLPIFNETLITLISFSFNLPMACVSLF